MRLRVAGAFALAMAVLLVVAGLAIRAGLRDEITDATDETLETRATAVARLIVDRGRPVPGISEGIDDPGETFTQVIGPGEEVVVATARPPARAAARRRGPARPRPTASRCASPASTSQPDEGDEELDTEALEETAGEPFEDDRARVLAAHRDRGRHALRDHLRRDAGGPRGRGARAHARAADRAPAGAARARRSPAGSPSRPRCGPVERMRRRAAQISDRSLSERLPVPGTDDEIDRLGRTLNAMLARLEQALETERAFAADASHELRTPLAILRGELEVALRRERSPEELRATIAAALDEAVRLSRLADDLLVMARADAGHLELQIEPLDAAGLLETVRDRLRGPRGRGGPARSPSSAGDPVVLRGDRARLEQALGNLVDNALRHGDGPVDAVRARGRRLGRARGRRPRRGRHARVRRGARSSASAAPTPRAGAAASGSGWRSCAPSPRRTAGPRGWTRGPAAAPRPCSGCPPDAVSSSAHRRPP